MAAKLNSIKDLVDNPPLDTDTYSEVHCDFYGLPSFPLSIYHTGDNWPMPTGPEAYREPKEARPVCGHPIADVWRELGRQVYEYFDSVNVKWTSIDPVRFAKVGEEAGPLFLWVGIMPGTLTPRDAKDAAVVCKKILAESQITDVEIAFRESVFTRSAGPQLLNYASFLDPTVDVRGPFTPALGLGIAARATPHVEGTGGLYLREGGESERVFLLTTRHAVLPPSAGNNELYVRNRGPRREVILLGSEAYDIALTSIMSKIEGQAFMTDYYKKVLVSLGEAVEGDDDARVKAREEYGRLLKVAEESVNPLDKFHSEITKYWSVMRQRVLGHIVHSPPISAGTGPKCFTEDWALVELHGEKINWTSFEGNVIDLGTKMPFTEVILKMNRDPETRSDFEYPLSRLLQLKDVVKEDELRHQAMPDVHGEDCIILLKNGNSTGVTIGRSTEIESFVREYDGNNIRSTSLQLAVYSYNYKDGAFSAPGDSGSIIADGKGRIVGLIIGGAGKSDTGSDVTYATPYYWLDERIKEVFPDAHLYPPSIID